MNKTYSKFEECPIGDLVCKYRYSVSRRDIRERTKLSVGIIVGECPPYTEHHISQWNVYWFGLGYTVREWPYLLTKLENRKENE